MQEHQWMLTKTRESKDSDWSSQWWSIERLNKEVLLCWRHTAHPLPSQGITPSPDPGYLCRYTSLPPRPRQDLDRTCHDWWYFPPPDSTCLHTRYPPRQDLDWRYPLPHSPREQTDRCENITFDQPLDPCGNGNNWPHPY